MKRLKATLRAVIAAIPLAAAGCGDAVGPTSPVSSAEQRGPLLLLGLDPLLKRAVPWSGSHVNKTYSVSGTIGPKGGTLAIPASDFTIAFAAGAVSSRTAIKITSFKGTYVTYDMSPHGITFGAPVTVTQGLKNTAAYSNPLIAATLVGAYVSNDNPPAADGSFVATELLPSVTSFVRNVLGALVPDKQTWQLKHFSRYMLASG